MGFTLLQCKWSSYVHQKRVKGRSHNCWFWGVCGRFGVRLSLEHENETVLQEKYIFLRVMGFLNILHEAFCLKWKLFAWYVLFIHLFLSIYYRFGLGHGLGFACRFGLLAVVLDSNPRLHEDDYLWVLSFFFHWSIE